MVMKDKKANVEVLHILRNIPKEQFELIPKDIIEYLENNIDITYEFKYDENNYNLSKEAAIILVDLYTTYISKGDEKKKIVEILNLNQKIDDIKRGG